MNYDRNSVKLWAGDSQWRALRADLARFRSNGYGGWGSVGFWALVIYRLQKTVHRLRPRWAWVPICFAVDFIRKFFTLITHIGIDYQADIGPGLLIPHGASIRVHGDTKIGADCALHHVCTIGAGRKPGGAIVGDHVWICCHSSIVGPVKIGDDAVIAANSLVIADVPAGATAIGVPAKILPGTVRPGAFNQTKETLKTRALPQGRI
jgi:serine O-acetyltransferase